MTIAAAGWELFPRRTSAPSAPVTSARPIRTIEWNGRPILRRHRPGARFSARARLAERFPPAAHPGPARPAGDHRLLDLLLNQLHAHLSAVAEDRAKVR